MLDGSKPNPQADVGRIKETVLVRGEALHRNISFCSYAEHQMYEWQRKRRWPHSHPHSVYVAAIGNRWEPGCEDSIKAMVEFWHNSGYDCWFEEIGINFSTFPQPNIDGAYDAAILSAQQAGVEYLCIVHNDVIVPPDIMLGLLARDVPIIGPLTRNPETHRTVGAPPQEPNQGLQVMRWVPLCFIMFRVSVFNCPGISYQRAMTEGLFFQNLSRFAHTAYVDTDLEIEVCRPLSLPDGLEWDERMSKLESKYKARYEDWKAVSAPTQFLPDDPVTQQQADDLVRQSELLNR